jgi:hypothetical protein
VALAEPAHGVLVHQLDARIGERAAVELGERRVLARETRHLGVDVDQRDVLDRAVEQDLAHREPVSPAEHEHAPRLGPQREGRMHQRLVVAVLVDARELQPAVQVELETGRAARHDDALVGRRLGQDDVVAVERRLAAARDRARGAEQRHERREHQRRARPQPARVRQSRGEDPGAPQADERVDEAEADRARDHADVRHEDQREGEADDQRADVVEAEHLGDQVLELELVLEDPQEQRDLEADQRPDEEDLAVEHGSEPGAAAVGQREHHGRGAACEGDGQLDVDEARDQRAGDELREPGADAEREEVQADRQRELGDRVAEQVGGERAGDELVAEAAGRDDEHGQEDQRQAHLLPGAGLSGSRRRR